MKATCTSELVARVRTRAFALGRRAKSVWGMVGGINRFVQLPQGYSATIYYTNEADEEDE